MPGRDRPNDEKWSGDGTRDVEMLCSHAVRERSPAQPRRLTAATKLAAAPKGRLSGGLRHRAGRAADPTRNGYPRAAKGTWQEANPPLGARSQAGPGTRLLIGMFRKGWSSSLPASARCASCALAHTSLLSGQLAAHEHPSRRRLSCSALTAEDEAHERARPYQLGR